MTGHPRDPVIASFFGTPNSASGIFVTADTAVRATAVYACVRVLAETVASLPLLLYRRMPDGGKRRATEHPLYNVIHHRPNRWQTSYEFRIMLMWHLALRGNGYAEILPGAVHAVGELIPLHPDRVRPFWAPDGTIAYEYTPLRGKARIILWDEMFHVRGYGDDLLKGKGAIEDNRDSIGLALAQEEYGSRFFSNDSSPGGVIEVPGTLTEEQFNRLKKEWAERHQGAPRSHKADILEDGMQWKTVSMSPQDSQFIESRKFQVIDIARIFRVPPHLIGDLEKTTFKNVEQLDIDFVVHTIRPILVCWEQALDRDVLVDLDGDLFIEYLVDGLLRGDIKTRNQALEVQRRNGVISANEWREVENKNPLPAEIGDVYLAPVNYAPVETLPAGEASTDGEDRAARLVAEAAGRILRRESRAITKINETLQSKEEFATWADKFYRDHADFVARALQVPLKNAQDYANESKCIVMDAFEKDYIKSIVLTWEEVRKDALTSICAPVQTQNRTHGGITRGQISEIVQGVVDAIENFVEHND